MNRHEPSVEPSPERTVIDERSCRSLSARSCFFPSEPSAIVVPECRRCRTAQVTRKITRRGAGGGGQRETSFVFCSFFFTHGFQIHPCVPNLPWFATADSLSLKGQRIKTRTLNGYNRGTIIDGSIGDNAGFYMRKKKNLEGSRHIRPR